MNVRSKFREDMKDIIFYKIKSKKEVNGALEMIRYNIFSDIFNESTSYQC